MARRGLGYATISHPERKLVEMDTVLCAHCQFMIMLHDRTGKRTDLDVGGFCRQCMASVCGPCADLGSCTPFEKAVEASERRGRLLEAIGVEL